MTEPLRFVTLPTWLVVEPKDWFNLMLVILALRPEGSTIVDDVGAAGSSEKGLLL